MSIDPRLSACKRLPTGLGVLFRGLLPAAIALIVATAGPAMAQSDRPAGIPACFQYKTLKQPGGQTYSYLLYLPAQYDEDQNHRWPVIITLHGSGECGRVAKMAGMALPRFVASRPRKFPFIVIAVNAPSMWYRGNNAAAVLEILDAVTAEHRTDPDRVYLTGYSMGGFGTWELAIARPDLFAAIVPVCGAGIPAAAGNIATLPTWAFHGAKDTNVPVAGSRQMIAAMKAAGGHPKYTEFPSEAHEIWEGVYRSMSLYKWLLEQRRPAPPRTIDFMPVTQIARAWWLTVVSDPNAAGARVRASIEDDGRINIATSGIHQWMIESNAPPLVKGRHVVVHWNGVQAWKGEFEGTLSMLATTQPVTRPGHPASAPAEPRN